MGWLRERVGPVGAEQPQQPRGSQAGLSPQAPGSARHWILLLGKGLNSSCGGTSFCCLWARKDKNENVSILSFPTALKLKVGEKGLERLNSSCDRSDPG